MESMSGEASTLRGRAKLWREDAEGYLHLEKEAETQGGYPKYFEGLRMSCLRCADELDALADALEAFVNAHPYLRNHLVKSHIIGEKVQP